VPDRLDRLPPQYFAALFGRVAAARAAAPEAFVDLARGNPEVGPPAHVVEALAAAAREPGVHGYPPFLGLPELKQAVAARYAGTYGVELDPEREVAVVPGSKTALVELPLCLAERGERVLTADPGYPDAASGIALAGAEQVPLRLDAGSGYAPDLGAAPRDRVAAVFLNYPSNPCAAAAPAGAFAAVVEYARATGAAVVHDFAYGDIVFGGRRPASFLAEPGAKEVGVELYSMSKSYGMAGWRIGFVVGSAEVVRRVNLLQDHARAGIFVPLQRAAIAALRGPQDTVEERRARYEARRDRALAALPPGAVSTGSFYVWFPLPERVTVGGLLAEHRLALAPGEGFGAQGAGWARLSLAVTDDVLDRGLERLAAVLGRAGAGQAPGRGATSFQ
jgi:aminotransferase